MTTDYKTLIVNGAAVLGIELGSTRIKCCLIDDKKQPFASGTFEWDNQLVSGMWTYSLTDIWSGLQSAYLDLTQQVEKTYGVPLQKLKALGVSAMMHGYMVFDKNETLLTPFRTWRNCVSSQAAIELTTEFKFNVPERWSIAHLYQAVLNGESHVADITYMTTLAGYIHWQLTGNKVLGIGDASGMFPINDDTHDYDRHMLSKMDELFTKHKCPLTTRQLLPKVLQAGEPGGYLSKSGAKLLDVTGNLAVGVPLCPPEGDAGTGMVATNTVSKHQGNVSAGTSIFAMFVLEHNLQTVYPEIDMVTTPDGLPVAMIHGNNCSTALNDCVQLFYEFSQLMGYKQSKNSLYERLFQHSLAGDKEAGGWLTYGYYSGEPLSDVVEGRPLMVSHPNANLTLANLMKSQLFSAFAVLSMGMEILTEKEAVAIDKVFAHGGLFKTKEVAQNILATVLDVPVSVMQTAGEGGAWGIALLADFLSYAADKTLPEYLNELVFQSLEESVVEASKEERKGYERYFEQYMRALPLAQMAGRYV